MQISLKNVSFAYDKELILKNANLEFGSGEFLSIIGPNGGGKSTLLKLILSLVSANSGEVLVGGLPARQMRHMLGFVPQNIPLNSAFPISVLEVALMGRVKKMLGYDKNDKKAALEVLEKVGLKGLEKRRIYELSGGQRQRAYIARALVTGAKVLVLDEPTASIDPAGQVQIFELLRELNRAGVGIIVVCHDVNLALSFASRVAFVNREIVLHESPQNSHFLQHLQTHHKHFCGVEMTLQNCDCVQSAER